MKASFPTPYPAVNQILALLQTHVKAILNDQLIGMYLHGSLANGGFDEHSDIDVIFLTKNELSGEIFAGLGAMHSELATIDSPWALQLGVSYIPQNPMGRADRPPIHYPHLDRGRGETLHWTAPESDWNILRHILRERGIALLGPDPKTFIDPVSPRDLGAAVVEGMPVWFNPILANPAEIDRRGYQSFFVLSMCRMLYTLNHGDILSKSAAASWGKEHLDARWAPLIERAIAGRQHPDLHAASEDINETLEMMRYTLQQINPTVYPEVNEVLNLLLTSVKEILGDQFLGMYLYGSLSTGDFNPETSDIDFVVITTDTLSEAKIAELESLHNRIWATRMKWALKVEGSYVPKALIRRHDPAGPPCPTVNEGKFYVDKRGSDWIIQRHVIREQGIILAGPDPRTIIDAVSPAQLRQAVRGVLEEWWFPMLDDPSWLVERGSEYSAYAILTMCRALHALEHGTIVSKPAAARWAQNHLDGMWKQVIEASLSAQKPGAGESELFPSAIELIRYTKNTLKT